MLGIPESDILAPSPGRNPLGRLLKDANGKVWVVDNIYQQPTVRLRDVHSGETVNLPLWGDQVQTMVEMVPSNIR